MLDLKRIIRELKSSLAEKEDDVERTRRAIKELSSGSKRTRIYKHHRRVMSKDAKRRISKMMKKRWAERKAKAKAKARKPHWTQLKKNKDKLAKVIQMANSARHKSAA